MEIKIKNGLDIPLLGNPSGEVKKLPLPETVALDLSPFEPLSFSLLKKGGEEVKVGEPLAQNKKCSEQVFLSPGSGKVKEIIRGAKRRILSIVIETDGKQTPFQLDKVEELFSHIRMRPCMRVARPDCKPEAIFVKAIESAPFAPPPELEVEGHEEAFAAGLKLLSEFAPVHLVHREGTTCAPFIDAKNVEVHSAEGPHPVGNPSVHIAAIHPILKREQVVWSLTVSDIITIGMWIVQKTYYHERVISVAGEGIGENERGFFRVNRGFPIRKLIKESEGLRLISGDPLNGTTVSPEGFLGFYDTVFCALPEPAPKREFLHFLKLKRKGYTAGKGYFLKEKAPKFSTRQRGEERAFVDGSIYDKVMPLPIQTMLLVKALITEQYEKGEALGLLEVLPEDFALPSFICPSKIEMGEIVREGLNAYSEQYYN
ncbi:NADH:ubiquinone reductase (Na(+)-transporting) subunit A [Candidatus Neptunochlamydia vexilliferae]|uniref:Na(+)-translocating NADH-quinone reductase subunit A n=1 Tax=Candidatus Neptunichlamydia vexilliferae TaxID=1651774 RepID=A0ABS0B0M3_9BACT|nr:NADH:ubiquinone reductase (Na(+)-transporting) subunit A [Candidatus Neptunochlamydia vexilliferae]MBF5059911.1 Na(+)-translocating NADH-quinone reductase subunit A [Candidatus Neptunochlamydia vexilliferae]